MRRYFSMMELLVVIGIIAILASLLLPALSAAREQAMLSVERGNMKQIGLAINLYAYDYNGRLVGANENGLGNHSKIRARLSPTYMKIPESGDKAYHTSADVWGCPMTKWNNPAKYKDTWWWNVGDAPSFDVDGNNIYMPVVAGYDIDRYNLFLDGRGFDTTVDPDNIVIITDSGFENNGVTWANHALPGSISSIRPFGSNSLCLSGRVLWRTKGQLNNYWRGGNGGSWR